MARGHVAVVVLGVLLQAVSAAAQEERALVSLLVNGIEKGTVVVYLRGGDVWVQTADLHASGLPQLDGRQDVIGGDAHVSLLSLSPGITFELDEAAVALRVTVPPDRLPATVVDLRAERPAGVLYQRNPSAFLNYAASLQDLRRVSLSGEAGLSVRGALLFSSFARDADGRLSRGFTNLTFDNRESLRRWVIGDTFAGGGGLGGSVPLAGVSVSRNFGLDPYFVRYPTLSYSGAALTPTSVDVYINDTLVRRERLPGGPFELRNLPVVAGSGSARLVLRDGFGRQEEIVLPIYFAPRLLTRGLSEYSYHLGVRRDRPGARSWDYGPPVFLGRHRVGVTDSLTAGLGLEVTPDLANGGTSIHSRLPVGEVELAGAWSLTAMTHGASMSVAYSYLGRPLNVGAFVRMNSQGYQHLSSAPIGNRPRTESNLSASLPLRRAGLTVQYARAEGHDRSRRSRASVLANLRLSRRAAVLLSVGRTCEPGRAPALHSLVSLNWYLGRDTAANASWRDQEGGASTTVEVQKSLPVGNGLGYRVRGQAGRQNRFAGSLEYNSSFGRYEAVVDQAEKTTFSTLRLSGGVVGIGGKIYLSRPVQDAFALIRVPGVARVRGYASNQEIGRTDADGDLLIPNLLSYYGNPLRIEKQDVPLDRSLDADQKTVAPPFRGGAVVLFPVRRVQQVIGRLRVAIDGRDVVPASGQLGVRVNDSVAESPLGTDGEFYLENIPPGRYPAQMEFEKGSCNLELHIPASTRAQVDLGTLVCVAPAARVPDAAGRVPDIDPRRG